MQIHATNSKGGHSAPECSGVGYKAAKPLKPTLSSFSKHREEPRAALYLGLRSRGQGNHLVKAEQAVKFGVQFCRGFSASVDGRVMSREYGAAAITPTFLRPPSYGSLSSLPSLSQPPQTIFRPQLEHAHLQIKANIGKLWSLPTYSLLSSRTSFLERNFAWSGALLLVKSEVT